MKALDFRLERVMRLRDRLVRVAEGELAAAIASQRETEVRLQQAVARERAKADDLGRELRQGLYPWEWQGFAGYLALLAARRREITRELEARIGETGLYRERLLERRRDLKVLDALRHRALAAHRALLELEERREMDEVAAARHGRERLSGF